jgi:SSS family solute:Na+ symporter
MKVWQISLLVITVFTAIQLYIGYLAGKEEDNTTEGFFLAGRSLGPLFLLLTYSATYQSAYAFLGAAGMVYAHGISFLVAATWTLGGSVLAYFIGIRIYLLGKKHGFITPGDMMGHYYGRRIQILMSILSIIWITLYMVVQLKGAGIVFDIATEGVIPYSLGSFVLLAIIILYVFLGGYRAVVWTDAFQGAFMLAALYGAAVFVLVKIGGIGELFAGIKNVAPASLTLPGEQGFFTPGMWLSMSIMAMIGHAICMPYSWVRFYTAKSTKALRQAVLLSAIFLTLSYIPAYVIGLSGRVLMPDLGTPDRVLPLMLFKFLNPALAAIIITGALAAMKSTVDSYVHIISAMVARDIYPSFNKKATDQETVRIGRIVIIVIGIVAYALSQMELGMLVMIGLIAYSGGAQFAPALFGAIYWEKGTSAGAWSSIIIGTAVLLFTEFVTNPFPLSSGTVGLILSFATYYIISLVTSPISPDISQQFHGYLKSKMQAKNT